MTRLELLNEADRLKAEISSISGNRRASVIRRRRLLNKKLAEVNRQLSSTKVDVPVPPAIQAVGRGIGAVVEGVQEFGQGPRTTPRIGPGDPAAFEGERIAPSPQRLELPVQPTPRIGPGDPGLFEGERTAPVENAGTFLQPNLPDNNVYGTDYGLPPVADPVADPVQEFADTLPPTPAPYVAGGDPNIIFGGDVVQPNFGDPNIAFGDGGGLTPAQISQNKFEAERRRLQEQADFRNATAAEVDARTQADLALFSDQRDFNVEGQRISNEQARIDDINARDAARLNIQQTQERRDFNVALAEQQYKDDAEAFAQKKAAEAAKIAFSVLPNGVETNSDAIGVLVKNTQRDVNAEVLDQIAGKGPASLALYNKTNENKGQLGARAAAQFAFNSTSNALRQQDTDVADMRLARLRDIQDDPYDPRTVARANNLYFDADRVQEAADLEARQFAIDYRNREIAFDSLNERNIQRELFVDDGVIINNAAQDTDAFLQSEQVRNAAGLLKKTEQNAETVRQTVPYLENLAKNNPQLGISPQLLESLRVLLENDYKKRSF